MVYFTNRMKKIFFTGFFYSTMTVSSPLHISLATRYFDLCSGGLVHCVNDTMNSSSNNNKHVDYGGISHVEVESGVDTQEDTKPRSSRREKRTRQITPKSTNISHGFDEEMGVPLTIKLDGNIVDKSKAWDRPTADDVVKKRASLDLNDECGREHGISSPTLNECRRDKSRTSSWGSYQMRRSVASIRNGDDLHSIAESVFSDIRSEGTETRLSISKEAEEYRSHSAWQRAFPERSFALIVTLVFELPTLFLISGGSDRLCNLIGRKKYTTLISLLPLISAIAGNVGLQASTLTTRAISHSQVRIDNYMTWLGKEIIAALYLGVAIGTVLASMSLYMTRSFPFALSIFVAQFIGIVTAGCTGTLAPLLFTFIFQRDSGKSLLFSVSCCRYPPGIILLISYTLNCNS